MRVPDRSTSLLYTSSPVATGLKSLAVNGKRITPTIENGYALIKRTWKTGDRVDLELPMEIQTITPDDKIEADRGRVALRYGPMIYNVEKADQPDINKYIGSGPLSLEWRNDLLGGVMIIRGKWEDGSPLTAIPNYARNNRIIQPAERTIPQSMVWIRKQ